MLVGLFLLHLLKSFKIISYSGFDSTLAKKALPVSLCFIANVVIGMVALRGTNIPMFASVDNRKTTHSWMGLLAYSSQYETAGDAQMMC